MAICAYGWYKCPVCSAKGQMSNITNVCYKCKNPICIKDLTDEPIIDFDKLDHFQNEREGSNEVER
jgi:hypothetical protein